LVGRDTPSPVKSKHELNKNIPVNNGINPEENGSKWGSPDSRFEGGLQNWFSDKFSKAGK
jgi:hypothetical protein